MNIDDKVEIKECHKQPDLIGKIAKVKVMVSQEDSNWPIGVELDDFVEIPVPGGFFKTKGPFFFKEEELAPANPNQGVPEAFLEE